jgi:hypothetical protein
MCGVACEMKIMAKAKAMSIISINEINNEMSNESSQ